MAHFYFLNLHHYKDIISINASFGVFCDDYAIRITLKTTLKTDFSGNSHLIVD